MKSSDYWKDRQTEDAHHAYEQAEDLAARIARIYRKATGVLNHQSAELFKRFRKKYGLTEAEARKLLSRLLNKGDIDRLIKLLEAGPNSAAKTEILKELEAPAYQARLERYRQLQNQIDQIMRTVYRQEKEMSSAFYTDLANESYYRGIFRMQQRAEAAFSFSKLDPEAVDKVIKRKWSGSNYSERIWKNTRTLANELKEEFAVSFLTGRGERETARIIANKFSQGATVARRLVRTETNYIHTEMNMEAYEDAQVEEYLFLATLDLKTSKICRSLDGKIFPVAARKSGKNCPPMHPWCRSTTIAVIDRELLGRMQRSAWDPVKKKRIKVPLTMSYEEWYEKYVKGHEEQLQKGEKKQEKRNLTQEQFERYRERGVGPETFEEFLKVKADPETWQQLQSDFKDAKEYKKWKEILGDDIPSTLEKYQEIKYNDQEKWKRLKDLKKYLEKYPSSDSRYYNAMTELKKRGIKRGVLVPTVIHDAEIRAEGEYDPNHIFNRMGERNLSESDVKGFLENARAMFIQWNGKRRLYAGNDGMCVIIKNKDRWVYRTAWSKNNFDDNSRKILEVLDNVGL